METVYNRHSPASLLNPIQPVYAFWGEDDRQKDEAITYLRKAIIEPGFEEFDSEVLDASVLTAEEILSAVSQVPMGSSHRLVVVQGAEVYRRREKSTEAQRLAEGIHSLGASSCLVLRVGAVEGEKGRSKTVLTAKLDEAIRSCGATVQCRALANPELLEWLTSVAAAAGKQIETNAGQRLIEAAHGDRTVLRNELEKAICFVGDAPQITLIDVDTVCSLDPEDVMFKLVDAISRQDANPALCLLREILRHDPKPQSVAGRLLALLARQFKLLWQAQELQQRGIHAGMVRNLPSEVARELPSEASIVGLAWKAPDLFRTAKRWNRRKLVDAFGRLLECDLANKGSGEGSEDVVTNVELLILHLCGVKKA
ncbi:MAG TPA: DNA polymerase III subunit delta [Chthonomonadales bacterium]|nr:DNA polymerase III subunit delta [Chthonomonadales bacterium]